MRSRILRPTILALLVLLLIAGSAPILAGADTPEQRATTGPSDVVAYGTAWVPELRAAFGNGWKAVGWGTEAKIKPARVSSGPSQQWVHIPLPYISREDGTPMELDLVQFCARSTNYLTVKPNAIHLWEGRAFGPVRFHEQAITWANNNNWQCVTVDISPDAWKEAVGISVRIWYAQNSTDRIVLGKAWARVVP